MGVPARHHTRSRVDKRRSHLALSSQQFIKCAHCGARIHSHQVCPYCGYYKGKMIIDIYKGLSKKEKKLKKKEMEEAEQKS